MVVVAFLWVSRLWRRRLALGLLLVAAFVPMLAWSTLDYEKFDTSRAWHMTGFDLTNRDRDYIKDAPARYATIRDIYVKQLESRPSEHRGPVDLILGRPDPGHGGTANTGQSSPQLSKTILHMDEYLIIHHQEQYSRAMWQRYSASSGASTAVRSVPSAPGLTFSSRPTDGLAGW